MNKPIEAAVCACGHTQHALTPEARALAWVEFDKAAATRKVRDIYDALSVLQKCTSLKTPQQARLEKLSHEMYRKFSWITELTRSLGCAGHEYDKFNKDITDAMDEYKKLAREWYALNKAENEAIWDKMVKGDDDE